jgi:hydroxymethylpyrimidine pyrophosphatase-like HAD family hydrolase
MEKFSILKFSSPRIFDSVCDPTQLRVKMRYLAFATDYDGTLATHGRVAEATIHALEVLKASGRKLLMVTGRQLSDLHTVFPRIELFDRIVAENGAVLYDPGHKDEKTLAEAPKEEFLTALREAGVSFEAGRAIVASWTPAETPILDVIKRLGLDYQVIFNKGAVMVLPSGVNKATGLRAALEELQLSFHNTVAIGDAENDHAFLAASECGVAVANALPALRQRADIVTAGGHGDGVIEIIHKLLENDLQGYDQQIARSSLTLGVSDEKAEVRIVPNRNSVLVVGASASGKSSAVAGILEEAAERGYQFCLIDPEGDFEQFGGAIPVGNPSEKPDAQATAKALESQRSLVVNLMSVPLRERPAVFTALLAKILETREKTGRPHWLVLDEAHHLLPTSWSPASIAIPQELGGAILITVHPEHVSLAALAFVDLVIATGVSARETLTAFAKAADIAAPADLPDAPETGKALIWYPRRPERATLVKTRMPKAERRRHRRNYAQGELSPEQSFYFRGPDGKLNLRAQNLMTFLQLGEGVDEETWKFHLRQGDFSRWFEKVIKDDELAATAREIERDGQEVPEGRARLRAAIEGRYTAPA